MEYDIFISYSTKDQRVADMVCGYLEERGLTCFISSRDIPKGVEWPSAIAAALKTSRLFLAVFSNNYNLSMQVNKELTIASKRHIPLLTFKTTEDDFEGTKDYFLSEVNFITAYPDAEKALKPLYENVSALLKRSSVVMDAPEAQLSFTYQEDRERIVKDLMGQKPKDPQKRLELAEKLAKYKEWQTAFYWYKKASEKDIKEAMFHLAECYQNGRGTKVNTATAVECFVRAYELGSIEAANRLGRLFYSGGPGLSPDYEQSLEWFEKCNSDECAETYQDLADYYSEGKACLPDEAKEFMYRKKYYEYHFYNALENEDIESMCILGTLCEEGKGIDKNDAYALTWFERAAKGGSNVAKYRLGKIYEAGTGVSKDPQKAFKYMEEASTYYDEAMVCLGDYYRKGFGTEENPSRAFQCYLLASSSNNVDAWYKSGSCYEKGIGTSVKKTKAIDCYKYASDLGYVTAQTALGKLLCRLPDKKDEGIANLENAASKGDYDALNLLAIRYHKSTDIDELKRAIDYSLKAMEINPKSGDPLTVIGRIYQREGELHDEKKAFDCFQKAADLGQLGAMRSLASCYANGKGVEQDDFMAFKWASLSVEKGNDKALNTLGEFYRFGIGIKKNPQKAIECYKKYFESGKGAMGAVNIGEMYFNGEGVDVDYDEATEWFQKACNFTLAVPYVFIGRMYEMGVYGEKNISQAISWYKKGEQIGSPEAEYYLGHCYANDEILPDPAKAVTYYRKSSDSGYMESKFELAKCLQQGVGTEVNNEEAFSLYQEIANRWFEMRQAIGSYVILAKIKGGTLTNSRQLEMKKPLYSEAMFNLGKCYIDGLGTNVNISEGVRWITIAAKLGNEEAAKYNLSESFRRADQNEKRPNIQ